MVGWDGGIHHRFTGKHVIDNGGAVGLERGKEFSFGDSIQSLLPEDQALVFCELPQKPHLPDLLL